jgi:hypothetical protein
LILGAGEFRGGITAEGKILAHRKNGSDLLRKDSERYSRKET